MKKGLNRLKVRPKLSLPCCSIENHAWQVAEFICPNRRSHRNRGPGETAKEKEMQHIERAMNKLKKELVQLGKTRETQRKKRLGSHIPMICIIGYTNAGKSTILNALTKSHVLAADSPFATLDTTTRELYIDHEKKGLFQIRWALFSNCPII